MPQTALRLIVVRRHRRFDDKDEQLVQMLRDPLAQRALWHRPLRVGPGHRRRGDLELIVSGNGFMLQRIPKGGFLNKEITAPEPPPPSRAALYGENLLIGLDQPMKGMRGEFLRDPDGAITWLRLGSRAHRRA